MLKKLSCVHTYSPLSSLDELAVQESSLRLKEQLLQQEKTLLKSQNEWLSSELQDKSEQLLGLRKEKVSSLSELESKLSQKQDEVCLCELIPNLASDNSTCYSFLQCMSMSPDCIGCRMSIQSYH